jgi:hypothetical protein
MVFNDSLRGYPGMDVVHVCACFILGMDLIWSPMPRKKIGLESALHMDE